MAAVGKRAHEPYAPFLTILRNRLCLLGADTASIHRESEKGCSRKLGSADGSLSHFNLPHAFASPPSSCGMPCGHLPRTLRGQFGKQPYPEHRALRSGGRGIARACSGTSASRKSQSPALTYRRAARAEWLPVRSTALWKRSHIFSHIVEQEHRSLFRSCFLPAEHIGDSKELALRARGL